MSIKPSHLWASIPIIWKEFSVASNKTTLARKKASIPFFTNSGTDNRLQSRWSETGVFERPTLNSPWFVFRTTDHLPLRREVNYEWSASDIGTLHGSQFEIFLTVRCHLWGPPRLNEHPIGLPLWRTVAACLPFSVFLFFQKEIFPVSFNFGNWPFLSFLKHNLLVGFSECWKHHSMEWLSMRRMRHFCLIKLFGPNSNFDNAQCFSICLSDTTSHVVSFSASVLLAATKDFFFWYFYWDHQSSRSWLLTKFIVNFLQLGKVGSHFINAHGHWLKRIWVTSTDKILYLWCFGCSRLGIVSFAQFSKHLTKVNNNIDKNLQWGVR